MLNENIIYNFVYSWKLLAIKFLNSLGSFSLDLFEISKYDILKG